MPRFVRNFWIEANIDGIVTPVNTGPRRKDGGFSMTIYMRSKGGVETAVRIYGSVWSDELELNVSPGDDLQVTPPCPGGFIVRSKR